MRAEPWKVPGNKRNSTVTPAVSSARAKAPRIRRKQSQRVSASRAGSIRSSCNGVASAAALLLRCQVLHHLAKVDDSRAQLVDGGVPILHARLPVRELLRQFMVVCVGVDFLLDLAAHIREAQLSRRTDVGEPFISHVGGVSSPKNKVPEPPKLSGRCHEVSAGSLPTD